MSNDTGREPSTTDRPSAVETRTDAAGNDDVGRPAVSTATAPLPPFNGLSQRQQRGMDCVRCGVTLTASTAVDLGPRPIRILDRSTRWFPRSCKSHRGDAEYAALLDHCTDCPTCPEGCETGAQLRRAVREARR